VVSKIVNSTEVKVDGDEGGQLALASGTEPLEQVKEMINLRTLLPTNCLSNIYKISKLGYNC
jgi:hypothetical protein